MQCRICRSPRVRTLGVVEYYRGFPWDVHQCDECGCRFTRYDPSVYDRLYSDDGSIYGIYRQIADECLEHFCRGDLDALEARLRKSSRYAFVIDQAKALPKGARTLEIGCSQGHLTSYFILAGHRATGADISKEAIQAATRRFGPHFVPIDANEIRREYYDLIYHVGTIGCAPDPIGLTRNLLELLKPGGSLIFNAPLLEACNLRRQLWTDAAVPPDLVTLFPRGFFSRHFPHHVIETIEHHSPHESALWLVRRMLHTWDLPQPRDIKFSKNDYVNGRSSWSLVERAVAKVVRLSGADRLIPLQPTPFGYFVTITAP